jgi:hypothetical protein
VDGAVRIDIARGADARHPQPGGGVRRLTTPEGDINRAVLQPFVREEAVPGQALDGLDPVRDCGYGQWMEVARQFLFGQAAAELGQLGARRGP